MSGLRYFDDIMHAMIAAERAEHERKARAGEYIRKCEAERLAALRLNTDRRPPSFFAASEGLVAARIIGGLS